MNLRPYQERAIADIRAAIKAGARRPLLVSPTGSGKTVILSELARRSVANGRAVLFLAHRSELIDQTCDTLTRFGLTVGAQCASARSAVNPFAPVQVSSVQTLLARNARPRADLVIPDEGHHFGGAAETFVALLKDYANALVVGATATPERGDGAGLRSCFDALVIGATVRELTALGHLVPAQIYRPEKALEPGKIAQNPVDAWNEHARGRQTILFARTVALANEYAQAFEAAGVTARTISADTSQTERGLYIDAFRAGSIRVLTSVGVLTEGFDAPSTSCVILARGCGSAGLYLQMVGRCLRPAPGKTDAVIIDLRGVSHEHGEPADERDYSLDGKGIRLRDVVSYCPVCGVQRTPPDPCDGCGYDPSSNADGGKPDTIVGVPLKPYHAFRETDSEDKRAQRLAKWLADTRSKGHKDGSAKFKFKAVYGQWPTAVEMMKAASMLAGAA